MLVSNIDVPEPHLFTVLLFTYGKLNRSSSSPNFYLRCVVGLKTDCIRRVAERVDLDEPVN